MVRTMKETDGCGLDETKQLPVKLPKTVRHSFPKIRGYYRKYCNSDIDWPKVRAEVDALHCFWINILFIVSRTLKNMQKITTLNLHMYQKEEHPNISHLTFRSTVS